MAIKRRLKVSAALRFFLDDLKRLRRFDFDNQSRFQVGSLTKAQRDLLVESIYTSVFRAYEGFIREIFILYCLEKKSRKKPDARSYLRPENFLHAENLIKSSMPFLDWTSPDTVITRAELYLFDGHPVKLPYTTNRVALLGFKKIRNHIAHNSVESEGGFASLVRVYYGGILPAKIPTPAEYLMLSSKAKPKNYLLMDFFDLMEKIANDLA